MPKYDFLIVGAGLFGATCARLLTDKGYKCLIIEKKSYVGGLAATRREFDIDVHLYGPHVFHTNDTEVWEFVNKYAQFNDYKHTIMALSNNKMYHFPVNMNTFYEIHNVKTPKEAKDIVEKDKIKYNVSKPVNLEEQAITTCGYNIYDKLIKGYSEKLWGLDAKEINLTVFKDIPIRYTYNNLYYDDVYQGVPVNGYTKLVEDIIGEDIDIMLNTDYLDKRDKLDKLATYVIVSGSIDRFCNYVYGPLKWRSLDIRIQNDTLSGSNLIGTSVLNICDKDNPILQIVENKWFTPEREYLSDDFKNNTIISYISAVDWTPDKEPMYPVNTVESEEILDKYIEFTKENFPNFVFGGRSGIYRPMNMSQTIRMALDLCSSL